MDVTILLMNGGFTFTALLPMDIFRCAGVLWNAMTGGRPEHCFTVRTAAPGGHPIDVGDQFSIRAAHRLEDVDRTDLVLVPAAGLDLGAMEAGYDLDAAIARNRGVVPWLREQAAKGAHIAGVCSGVALLAEAGLLNGRRATTHWALEEQFRRRFPAVTWDTEYLITESDRVYCGGGVNAAADLSLYLVQKFFGRETAAQCARAMLLEMPRTWQIAFAHLEVARDHGDEAVLRAQEWIHGHYHTEFRIDDLALRMGMSPRNFIRRFKSATGRAPLDYLQALRVAAAKRLLESGRGTVQEIGSIVGYDDAIFFRSLFRRHAGLSPSQYRQRHMLAAG